MPGGADVEHVPSATANRKLKSYTLRSHEQSDGGEPSLSKVNETEESKSTRHMHCRYIYLDNDIGMPCRRPTAPWRTQPTWDQIQPTPAECGGQDLARKLRACASGSSSAHPWNDAHSSSLLFWFIYNTCAFESCYCTISARRFEHCRGLKLAARSKPALTP